MNKTKLHVRSYHNKLYNFDELICKVPELQQYVIMKNDGVKTVDFSNSKLVYLLNKALLLHFYDVSYWEVPLENLIPPIPGRADYIHYLADLMGVQSDGKINVLDIGTGASLIYPLIGSKVYNWNFVASDIDTNSLLNAENIIKNNPDLSEKIFLRKQNNEGCILDGIVKSTDFFDAIMCNPPFFKSKKDADAQTLRKLRGLNKTSSKIKLKNNFSGKSNELWCKGGELVFLFTLISESVTFKNNVKWFTSLVSNADHLEPITKLLKKLNANYKIIDMNQGNKSSRFIAWKFL